MPIYYLAHTNIDRQRWDTCVQQAANSLPYCYSWYLDIVSPQWDALILDDYSAIMPLTWKKKYGVRYLHQPFFTQQLGVFAITPPDAALINAFLMAIPQKFRYLDFYLNYANFSAISPTFTQHQRINYVLSLNDNYEQLYLGYKANTRGTLKKIMRNPQTIVDNIAPEAVIALFETATSAKIDNLQITHYQMLERLTKACVMHNMAQTFGIYNEQQQLIAAIFLIKTPKRLINLISTSNAEAREQSLMFKIIDHIIREYARTNTLLDFEGSMINSIAAFYRGFGAKETYYWHLLKKQMPKWVNCLRQTVFLQQKEKQ